MIFFKTSRMSLKLTTFFIEVNDIKIFVRKELLGQKEKKVKLFDIFSAIERWFRISLKSVAIFRIILNVGKIALNYLIRVCTYILLS